MAAVALANKLNANMLRTWVAAAERTAAPKLTPAAARIATLPTPAKVDHASFLSLHLETTAPAPATTERHINVELRRGTTTIKVEWPVSAAAEYAEFDSVRGVVYDFAESRVAAHPKAFLGSWSGHLVCDDMSATKDCSPRGSPKSVVWLIHHVSSTICQSIIKARQRRKR